MLEITNDRTKKFFFVGYCQIHCIEQHVLQTSKGFCFLLLLFLGSLQNAQRDTVNLAVIDSFRSEFTVNL